MPFSALPVGRWPAWLPRGGSLPDNAWRTRHLAVMALLWAHVVAIPLYAGYRGNSSGHAWIETAPVLMAALVAGFGRLGRRLSASVAAGGLMICSGVIVHLSGGMIEAHFHFFVMIPVIALYEAWAPFTLAVAYVLVHHGVMGTLDPQAVYSHSAARERPWLFAGVHATFFAFACIACVINWWLQERARLAVQSQTRLMSTIVSLRDGLVVLDAEGKVILRNPAGAALLGGITPGDSRMGAAERYGLARPDGTPVTEQELLDGQALVGDSAHDFDLVVRNPGVPEGRVLNFSATALPTVSADEPRAVVVVFRDITERHRTQQALADALATEQDAVERLRELERVKSDFVSTVSHELRTPITSIIGYLELLADGEVGELDRAQLDLIGRVDRNSHRLLGLVEDLLRLSEIESASLTIDAVPTDLYDVVSAAYAAVGRLRGSRSLDVTVDVPEHPVRMQGDPAELERMLVNLLGNAIKFTPDGGRVGVRLDADDHTATLVVTDTGMGIPEAEQGRLFTRFFRSTTATERAVQGTGLGLTIVQAVVALHDGSIVVESALDRGTTVTVSLPRRVYPAAVVA